MGTRADFYVGTEPETMEWLGSIAWDGYPEGIDDAVLDAKTEDEYRAELDRFFATRDDATRPADGWPWPWEDSHTTDCAYTFDKDQVLVGVGFGARAGWVTAAGARVHEAKMSAWNTRYRDRGGEDPSDPYPGDEPAPDLPARFPEMSDRKSVTFGARSGLIVVGGK